MKPEQIIAMIDAYAEETGLSVTTIGARAAGDTRLYERLKRRCERDEVVASRVRTFIAENPPQANKEAS